jgi:hypothetical protein
MSISTNVQELLDNANGDVLTEIRGANLIQLVTGTGGTVWINVDGVELLRITKCESVYVDTSNAPNSDVHV